MNRLGLTPRETEMELARVIGMLGELQGTVQNQQAKIDALLAILKKILKGELSAEEIRDIIAEAEA